MTAPDLAAPGPVREGESRWPMALAVAAIAALSLVIPDDFRLSRQTAVLYPTLLVVLLVVLVVGDPGRIDRESRWLRVTTSVMIGLIIVSTTVQAVRLVAGILQSAGFASPGQLLAIGAIILATNMLSFALLFWHLDCGGAAARALGRTEPRRAFVFPESDLPELDGQGWYPQYVDYLALSFNTSTAFSPTDVSAVKHWAKLLLIAESSLSLVIVVLVVARAINILQ